MIALAPSPLGVETLDDPACDPGLARATLRDIARANRWFGGVGAAAFGVDRLLAGGSARRLTLLDVGAGGGDVAQALRARARRRGIELVPLAVDSHRSAAALCRDAGLHTAVATAAALPIRPGGVDIVLASQFLHHFRRDAAIALLQAFARLAQVGFVVADARRTAAAAWGIWLGGLALGFHPVTRRDGVLSVRRSCTAAELRALVADAGLAGTVHRRPGFRLVAVWRRPDAHR